MRTSAKELHLQTTHAGHGQDYRKRGSFSRKRAWSGLPFVRQATPPGIVTPPFRFERFQAGVGLAGFQFAVQKMWLPVDILMEKGVSVDFQQEGDVGEDKSDVLRPTAPNAGARFGGGGWIAIWKRSCGLIWRWQLRRIGGAGWECG
jgi:hypothetical protein